MWWRAGDRRPHTLKGSFESKRFLIEVPGWFADSGTSAEKTSLQNKQPLTEKEKALRPKAHNKDPMLSSR